MATGLSHLLPASGPQAPRESPSLPPWPFPALQITNIQDVRSVLREAAYLYAELAHVSASGGMGPAYC